MRKIMFVDNGIYHVFNRGIEKRNIFLDDQDYFRFIHNLFEFNDENPVINTRYYFDSKTMNVESRNLNKANKNKHVREKLVEILVFTLMPNHFHLLLMQRKKNGIQRFIQKVCIGYVMYFNQKYERVGGLFQGRFKAVMADRNEYFQYLPHYIHLNPLGIKVNSAARSWREGIRFLENYKWSSFPDYIGKKNFPSVTKRDSVLKIFGGEAGYKRNTRKILKELHKDKEVWTEKIKDLILD
jgi:putative transposase